MFLELDTEWFAHWTVNTGEIYWQSAWGNKDELGYLCVDKYEFIKNLAVVSQWFCITLVSHTINFGINPFI